MEKAGKRPLWNWIALSVGVLGIVASVVSYKLSQRAPEPCYVVASQRLIGESAILSPHVAVTHDGKPLPRVTSTRIVFWNSGKAPIRASDVIPDDPIRIRLSGGARIIDASVRKVSRKANGLQIFPTTFDKENGEIRIEFKFLDAGDGVTVDLLHTGKETELPRLTGTIVGVPNGIIKNSFERPLATSPVRRTSTKEVLFNVVLTIMMAFGVAFWAFLGNKIGANRKLAVRVFFYSSYFAVIVLIFILFTWWQSLPPYPPSLFP